MTTSDGRHDVDRRRFLAGVGSVALVISGAAVIHTDEAWGLEVKNLRPETMRTLIKMARDVYPHDQLADHYYMFAVTPWDAKAAADANVKALIEGGIALLDENARARYKAPYAAVAWEEQRVALLHEIEQSE